MNKFHNLKKIIKSNERTQEIIRVVKDKQYGIPNKFSVKKICDKSSFNERIAELFSVVNYANTHESMQFKTEENMGKFSGSIDDLYFFCIPDDIIQFIVEIQSNNDIFTRNTNKKMDIYFYVSSDFSRIRGIRINISRYFVSNPDTIYIGFDTNLFKSVLFPNTNISNYVKHVIESKKEADLHERN